MVAASVIAIRVDDSVAIARQCDGEVNRDQVVPAVKLCNWEDLSARGIVSFGDHVMWNPSLDRLATWSSVCFGDLCRLPTMFTLSPPAEQIVFVHLEVLFLNLRSVYFDGVFENMKMGPEAEW